MRGGTFSNKSGEVHARLECSPDTVRHSDCHMLVDGKKRCPICTVFRNSLFSMTSRETKQQSAPASVHKNIRYMSSEEKDQRIQQLTMDKRAVKAQMTYLKNKLAVQTEEKGVLLDGSMEDLIRIAGDHQTQILKSYPEESFQRLFWEQQLQTTSTSPKGRRWHPTMIKWCLYLGHQSSHAYELLRKSGCIHLPSQRSLRDYTHHSSPVAGFSVDIDLQLIENAGLQSLQEFEKHVCLIGDEMHIKEDLVYDKVSGELIGFVNLGDIANHLQDLEQQLQTSNESSPPLATTVFVFMVRGLFIKLNFPYATFPAKSVSADQLLPLYLEAVFRLERNGFRVIGTTLDGYSANRRLINILAECSPDVPVKYKAQNPWTLSDRKMYFFSDPPHLLKTISNCMANSKRSMTKGGQRISWKFIEDLYKMATTSMGLTTQHKLKYEHVYLTSFSKMRVDLAAQVLSETVAKGLQYTFKEEARETALFVEKVDKFFDCLNVTNYTKSITALKPFKMPYRCGDDFRMKWLKEFLEWLDDWECEVEETDHVAIVKAKMMLSRETLVGIRITVHSLLELVPYLFTIPGVNSFLSERISQDPLEKYFGRQRQRGGVNDNPNASQFLKGNQALRVVNAINFDVVLGNTRGSNKLALPGKENAQPLRKRRRQSSDPVGGSMECDDVSQQKDFPYDVDSPLGMLVESLKAAVQDEGFLKLPSSEAHTGHSTACDVLNHAISNSQQLQLFAKNLVEAVKNCFKKPPTSKLGREKVWTSFYSYITSAAYKSLWSDLMKEAQAVPSPVLHFYATHYLFKIMLKKLFPTNCEDKVPNSSECLSQDEVGALQYVGGYIIRSVTKKIERQASHLKEEMVAALSNFREDTESEEISTQSDEMDWVTMCDRGGLYHVTAEFFNFLYAVEVVMKRFLTIEKAKSMKKGFSNLVEVSVSGDDDVQQWWEILCVVKNVPDDVAKELIHYIIEHYIVVRGFSFAARSVELYKRNSKKKLQKSKGLRKKLQSN